MIEATPMNGFSKSLLSSTAALLVLLLSASCAHVPKRNPLPADQVASAEVLGIPRSRMWGDEPPSWEHAWLQRSKAELRERYPGAFGKQHHYLALSGGGENGAFAAGLLVGWTAAGTRPEFTIVTGISAGALIAPFAFLGSEYDDVLEEVSVKLTADKVYKKRGTLRGLRTDAMASTEPLKALIAKYVDQELIEKIAAEYRNGRELDIGTANLDAMRPVIWRIGPIANSGHPQALRLIRQIMLASASIPVAFPPVLVQVEANGKTYDELHVDGGAAAQVFLYQLGSDWEAISKKLEVRGRPQVYVIRNSRLVPVYQQVDNKLFPIAGRSLDSIVRTQGIGDLNRIYIETCRDGLDFKLAYIPPDFTEQSNGSFDPAYVRALFEMARERAKGGYPWERSPPELRTAPIDCN